MSRIQLSLTASLIAINTLAFAETPFKVSTASHEGATVTSIWAGESGFVGQPQWDARGKSFFILESTGSIHQIAYPSFQLLKSTTLDVVGSELSQSKAGLVIFDKENSSLVTFNSAAFKVKTRISIPELSAVATAPASHYAFVLAGEKPQLTVVNLKSKEITPFQDPEFAFLGGQFFAVTADGKHVFVGDRGMAHLTVDDGDLSFIQKSPWIASNPGGIFTSPDSKYVALPSGGGNDGVAGMPRTGYGTYLFNASDLDAGIRRVESGAYPRSIGWDAGGKWIFAHDFDHQLKVYDQETLSLRVELILSQRGNDSLRFTSHPQGQGRLLVTIVGAKPQKSGPARLFFIELD